VLVSSFAWLTNRASQRQAPPNIRLAGLFTVRLAPLKREKAARERRPSRREEWRFAD